MLNIYKKGNNEWYDSVPIEQEATPFVPMWSSGDGYQTNNLLIYRASDLTITTTGSYGAGEAPIIYNLAINDDTDWYDTTEGTWLPTVAGWWQITLSAFFGGGGFNENAFSLTGAVSGQVDSIGGNWGVINGMGYFNGTTSQVRVNLITGNSANCDNPQDPSQSYFQALFIRP